MIIMTSYGAKELAGSFRTVRKNTIQIASEIPEDQYGFQAAPGTRTIGQLLIHIASASRLAEQLHIAGKRTTLAGFNFMEIFGEMGAEEQAPHTKDQIIAKLTENGARFGDALEGLSDEFLSERVGMLPGMQPESKSRIEMLLGVKEHEMHHRAQLMLLERMLGHVPHLTREMQARMAAMASATK